MSQLKKYKRLKYLGKGSYGAAILVELRSNPSQRFVIKEIVIGHLKPAERTAAKSEAEVLHQMNHSNITMYIESFVENEKLYIVMENADGGDLSTAIQHRKKDGKYWDEEEVMRIFVQICLALQHVHNQNILHRDLKSQNIFLTLKGVVKLGDFGIAKVLDATDDQARTQIGTPYYLSPEICESKPYGRESDVWSLGVLLYEIIALEMPFQATSLPALVHRICVAEPNYSVVEKRYSAGLIELTKNMLMKDPQKRPSVSQIVKSEFIKTHISRLLSYTLRSGNAGVEMPLLVRPKNLANLDVHEAEKVIESVHSQQREAESKEVRNQSNREAARIAEREKLRKFRNDMQQQRARGDAKNDDSKDEDNRVVYKPAPSRAVGANGRDLSPKSGRNVSPMSGRNLSPKGGRPISPMGRNNNLSPKSNRPVSPTPKVNRPISPTPRVARPVSPTPKVSRPISPTPRNMSPVNARAGGGAYHSHHHHNNHNHNPNYNNNNHNGERALTPRGAAAQRDKERKLAAAAAMKQGYAEVSAQSQYAQRDPRDINNPAAGALQRGGHNNGYGYPSQQQIQQQQHNQQQASAAKANNANEYDSVARREFFANRAAAQAVKAKIEAYDRHGPAGAERAVMGGGGGVGGGGVNAGAPVRYSQQPQQQQQPYGSHPSSRRGSEVDQSYALQAGAHFDDDSHSVASRASRQSCDGEDYGRMDPETRIAHIKAQKEKERQRENAEKEMQIKQAIEANRDARRSLQNAKSAVAFDIDLGGNNAGPSIVKAPPINIARNASRQSLDGDKPSASPLADNSPKSIHSEAPSRLVRANVREDKGSSTPVESDSGKGRSKKSWGPPVAAKDIAKGITRYSEYSTPTSQMFAPPGERDRSGSVSSSNITDSGAVDMNKGAYFDDEAASNAGQEEESSGRAHRREMSRDSIDQAALVGDEDEVVLRRLESKRNSQMQQRQQAKEMFKKLREKRRQQSEGKARRVTGADAKPSSVISPIKRPNPDEVTGLPRAANASPMQLRLMEVMSQVDLAQESVQKAIGSGESSVRSRNAENASGRSRTNSDAKGDGVSTSQANTPQRSVSSRKDPQPSQQVAESRFPHIAEEEDEDELTNTLENWLTEQKRVVTTRRKHGHALDRDDETPTPIEDDMEGYTTQSRYDRDSQAKGSPDEVRDEKTNYYISGSLDDTMYNDNGTSGEAESEQSTQKMVRGKYMGNDVEVVGLQCMLAQALMGDGDED